MPLFKQIVFSSLIIALVVSAAMHASASNVGKQFPSEKKTFTDEKSGLQITALTTSKSKDDKLYQTHPNWLADGEHIIFNSDRSGETQLFAVNEASGVITQLTDGSPISFACLDRRRNHLIIIQDSKVKRIDAGRILADSAQDSLKTASAYETICGVLPEHFELRDKHTLDADGQWLYQCIRDKNTDEYMLVKFNLESGEWTRFLKPSFMPGHIQANPVIPGLIMYCHETGGDAPYRIWVCRSDGSGNQPLYLESKDEWVTHEVWWGMDRVLFNLSQENKKMGDKPFGIASVRYPDRTPMMHYEGPNWHVAGTPDQRYGVVDTFKGELILVDIATGETRLLCQGNRPNDKVHAHQSISPNGGRILFASGKFGNYDIMTLKIPVWDDLR